jgi:hypothetical protein
LDAGKELARVAQHVAQQPGLGIAFTDQLVEAGLSNGQE